jgi:outer membrane protein assembly factor BamA
LKAPDYAMNYFGLGNESVKDSRFADGYYRLRANQQILEYSLGHRWGKTAFKKTKDGSVNESKLMFGAFFKRSNVEENEEPNRFIADLGNNGLSQADIDRQLFTGIHLSYSYANLDKKVNAKRGFELSLSGRQYFQINGGQNQFLKLNADLRAYVSFTKDPRAVLALRFGGSSVFGDYTFLEAAQLGGKTNLRGYLADRFYGDQSIYQNTEFRYKLVDFSAYLLKGELGILGFYDAGRVWLDGENSDKWHKGYGSGFWVSPFELTILTATYNWSDEDNMLQVSLNFKF